MEEILSEVFGIWFLIGAALVFFMQAGFAMVEAGFTRAKNAGNIIMKNLMDFCLGAVAFLVLGYSFLCGADAGNGLIGWINPANGPLFDFVGTDWSSIYSFVISLIVYPIEAHWVWGPDGWLTAMGFHDFAGSAVIHYVGGLTALIGAKLLGPRIGKFNEDGSPNGIPGHSLTLGALGCFILWFGWYGFNGAAATNGLQLATIFATTTIAPALATVTVMIFTWVKYGKPDVGMSLNGSLAGLVAITAGCDAVDALGAAIIGILAGFTVVFFAWLLDYKLKIDDPVGAVAVHMGNGILGTVCVGLFACGTDTMPEVQGLFYGGGADLLITQITGLLAIGVWTAITMTITFVVIKKTIGLRVTPQEEIEGLDKLEHGLESSYAGFAFENESISYPGVTVDTIPSVTLDEAVPVETVSNSAMSKVVVIAKPERLDALKTAMNEIGVAGMTVTKVMGCGVQKGHVSYYRGAKVDLEVLPKLKAEIVVSSIPVQTVVDAARKVLYTGNMGDGKIFIYDVRNVVRVSSGEQGEKALTYTD